MNAIEGCNIRCGAPECMNGCKMTKTAAPRTVGNWSPYSVAPPRGCICPAGAEKTCQGWNCPRQPPRSTAGATAPIVGPNEKVEIQP